MILCPNRPPESERVCPGICNLSKPLRVFAVIYFVFLWHFRWYFCDNSILISSQFQIHLPKLQTDFRHFKYREVPENRPHGKRNHCRILLQQQHQGIEQINVIGWLESRLLNSLNPSIVSFLLFLATLFLAYSKASFIRKFFPDTSPH